MGNNSEFIKRQNVNEKGFTLPAIIVSATVMSILALGLSNIITQNAASVYYLEDKSAGIDLKNIISLQLSDINACEKTFNNLGIEGATVGVIKDKNGASLYTRDQAYDQLSIGDIRYENNGTPSAVSATGLINLTVNLTRKRNNSKILKPLIIPIQVRTAATAPVRIESCVAVGNGASLEVASAGDCEKHPADRSLMFRGTSSETTREEGSTFEINGPESEGSSGGSHGTNSRYVCINKKWIHMSDYTYSH